MTESQELTVRQARELLWEWNMVTHERDARIGMALDAGMNIAAVSREMGVSRALVYRVIGTRAASSGTV
jgi:transposase-like protein